MKQHGQDEQHEEHHNETQQRIIEVEDISYNLDISIILKHKQDFLEMAGHLIFYDNNLYYGLADGAAWLYEAKNGKLTNQDLRWIPDDVEE